MSSGVLFFAFDSKTDQGKSVHYTRLAKIAKNLVKKHLGLPCAIASNTKVDGFDETIVINKRTAGTRHVLVNNVHENYIWYNNHRVNADQLTPWSRTLMLDVDYFLQSDNLLNVVNSDYEFLIMRDVKDATGRNRFDRYKLMPNRTIPQLWATAMCWDSRANYIFEYAREIENNYEYYSRVFGFSSKQYRNDMIFSIAAHMSDSKYITWPMWMTSGDCLVNNADHRGIKLSYQHKNKQHITRVGHDLHCLSKTIATDEKLLDHLEHWSLQ